MKCLFCDKQIVPSWGCGYSLCKNHPVGIHYFQSDEKYQYAIKLPNSLITYLMSFDRVNSQFSCYYLKKMRPQFILKPINYIPDIAPEQAIDKLKAWLAFT